MKKYTKYRDSGISWLGEVPEHWKISKIKHILFHKKKTLNPELSCGSISFGNIIYKDDNKVPVGTKATYQEVLKGEFLVNPLNLNFDLKSLRTGLSAINVVVSTGYIVLQTNDKFNKRYLKWLLHQFDVSFMKTLGSGVRQTLNYTDIKNSYFPYISLPEQTAIANFLDHKLEKIECFISKKKALIELLNEQKAAIINQAVTKGLNPNIKTKPSGIEWLGDIPFTWKYGKLKHLCNKIGDGIHSTPTYSPNGKIPFINGNNLIYKKITITDRTSFVDDEEYQKHKIKLKSGALLISINGTIGNLAFYNGEKVIFGKSAAYIELNEMSYNQYLYYLLHTDYASKYFISTFQGTTINNLSLSAIRKMTILIPILEEQLQIVEYIEAETAKIAKTISTIEKEIRLVEEYKTALIAEAVTGKIDVRNFNDDKKN